MQYAGWCSARSASRPVRNSRLVELSSRRPIRSWPPTWPTRTRRAYIEQNLEHRFSASKDATDWLEAQLAEQRKKVEASEADLQRYKEQHDAVAVEDRQNIVVQRLADLNAAVTKAKTTRIEKEALYNQLKAMQNSNALDSFPAVLANDYMQKLKGDLGDLQRQQAQLADKYGDRHPEMVKVRSADSVGRGKARDRDRQDRGVGEERVRHGGGAGAHAGRRARGRQVGGAQPQSQGHRVQRAAARGREQPAGLRGAAAADEGNGHFR